MRDPSSSRILRTRFGRRMAALFVLTALVPIGALAAVSYLHVTRSLSDQARRQLRHASKTAGMDIMSGLRIVDDRMLAIRRDLSVRDPDTWGERGGEALFLGTGLEAVSAVVDGRVQPIRGERITPPVLDDAQRARLRADRPLLAHDDRGRPLLAVRMGSGQRPEAVLWARLNLAYLWGGSLGEQSLDDDVELCVLGPRGEHRVLSCTLPDPTPLIAALDAAQGDARVAAGQLDWVNAGTRMIGGYWSLFLEFGFGAPPWTIVQAQPRSVVLASVGAFRATFVFVVLLTVWVVLFLSQVQIRRSLVPLATLKHATDRVGDRHFGDPVRIDGADEFSDLAASFNAMTGRLERDFSVLEAINGIDRAVLEARGTADVVNAFFDRAPLITGCRTVHVSVSPTDPAEPWMAHARTPAGVVSCRAVVVDEGELAELGGVERVLVTTSEGRALIEGMDPGNAAYLLFPVRLNGQVAAVVGLGYASLPEAGSEADAQTSRLIDQFAVALSNRRYVEKLDEMGWGAIQALSRTVDAKSPWTGGHSERVTMYALQTGRVLGLTAEQLDTLHRGGLLHDIGKIGVPGSILNKPDRLTAEEMAVMQAHTTIGGRVLEPIRAFSGLVPIAMHHHEKMDGSGYPHHLVGQEIPYLARVLAVADVYDALRSHRPYRSGWPRAQAIAFIRDESGPHFDPDVAAAFLEMIAQETRDPYARLTTSDQYATEAA